MRKPETYAEGKPVYSISGILIPNVSDRDRMWLDWIEKHGASDHSIRRFLEENPTPEESSETARKIFTMLR